MEEFKADYHTFDEKIGCRNGGEQKSEGGGSMRSSYSITKPDSQFHNALFNFVKSFVGIGATIVPGVMKYAGIVLGLVGIFT